MSRYSTRYQIKQTLKTNKEAQHAILPMYSEDGMLYGDDSPVPSLIIGAPNSGKSVTLCDFIRNCYERGEIVITSDTKGTLYAKTAALARQNGYEVLLVNFCDPAHSDGFDPLYVQAKGYRENDELKELAGANLFSLIESLVPKGPDAFWEESSTRALEGAARYLFELFEPDEIGATALHDVLNEGERRISGDLVFAEMASLLNDKLDIANPLLEIANSPSETRASTIAVAKAAISKLTKTEGMRQILERNNIDLFNFDCEKKVAFYFIVPDETDVYSACASAMFDQVIKRYYRHSRETGKALKRRVNVIIDELGNLGRAMGDFDKYCTAARSRNIRITACLQSYEQLHIFGQQKMQVIKDAGGNTICFSLNNLSSLTEISDRAGTYQNPITGRSYPTISPRSIAAFKPGQALVFCSELLFVNQFEYDEAKSTDVPIVFPKSKQPVELGRRTNVLRPVLEAKRAAFEKELRETLSEKLPLPSLSLPKPKKQGLFKRIYYKFLCRKIISRFKKG